MSKEWPKSGVAPSCAPLHVLSAIGRSAIMRSLFFGLLSRLLAGGLRLARVCSKKALQLLFGFILNPVQGSELRLARLTKCEGYRRALYVLSLRSGRSLRNSTKVRANQHALALGVSCAQSRSVSPREKAGAGHRERKQERGTADAGQEKPIDTFEPIQADKSLIREAVASLQNHHGIGLRA